MEALTLTSAQIERLVNEAGDSLAELHGMVPDDIFEHHANTIMAVLDAVTREIGAAGKIIHREQSKLISEIYRLRRSIEGTTSWAEESIKFLESTARDRVDNARICGWKECLHGLQQIQLTQESE